MSDLRAICEAATPGPWEFASVAGLRFGSLDGGPEDDRHAVLYFDDVPDVPHAGNRRFIETFNPERVSKMLDREAQLEAVAVAARRFHKVFWNPWRSGRAQAMCSDAVADAYGELRSALAVLHESEDE